MSYPQSPDLNPIESLWSKFLNGVYLHGKQYRRKNLLCEALSTAASNIRIENDKISWWENVVKVIAVREGYIIL